MPTDVELLRRYVEARDEAAFAELVRTHLPLVYGAALRRTNGRSHVAEEIAQKVFADLARKAAALQHHPALIGWLHRSTRYAAIDVARSELRRAKLTRSIVALTNDPSFPEPQAGWENLRPVIDASLDELKEADREIILLRYFDGLSFATIGERLQLTENTARMRADRALGKLRIRLGRRGVTSSAAVLGLSLASQGLASVPAGLSASIVQAAMATAPAGVVASFFTTLVLNKLVAASIAAGVMAGLCGVGWSLWKAHADAAELTALRAENSRLFRALAAGHKETATGAAVVGNTAPAAAVTLPEDEVLVAGQHRDEGQATAMNALLTFAWACDTGNAAAVSRLITFSEESRAELVRLYSKAPASVRARYPTPEELFIHATLVSTVLKPPTGVAQIKRYEETEAGPDRVILRRPGAKRGGFTLAHTAAGWKIEVAIKPGSGIGVKTIESELAVKLGIN